jgi:predicted alpha-1,6-mannanase (GH76 family)
MPATIWKERVEYAQQQTNMFYWNPELKIMNQWYPIDNTGNYYYWWQAHAIDVVIDAYLRTEKQTDAGQILALMQGAAAYNNGTLHHNYYDDMEWMALALLRAYDATQRQEYLMKVQELWLDIQTAWNTNMGGGMAWKKDQLDYKNTPANAPAAILAARLFHKFGKEEDLQWALKIYQWNLANLVDPETGFVWDGLNRQGDGLIDYDWEFTYCQGVFIGAGIELFRCTGKENFLADAKRTALATLGKLVHPETGMLPDEGIDDTGLFKGILIRYLVLLLELCPDLKAYAELIRHNAEVLWTQGMDLHGRFSASWTAQPEPATQLSVQLSGLMLLEAAASLESRGFFNTRGNSIKRCMEGG